MVLAFKAWLKDPVNQPVLFIVDDLDRLKDAATIKEALPREAQIILCSTRDPSIVIDSMDRSPTQFKIQSMGIGETTSLLRMILRRNNVAMALVHPRAKWKLSLVPSMAMRLLHVVRYLTL